MKVLIVLTYYRPYVSGLSICAELVARALCARGHEVTVLTSRYNDKLSPEETIDGVRVIRVPVLFRISKGVIMPAFVYRAARLAKDTDIVHLFLPQFDAPFAAIMAKFFRKPVTITYACDIQLPAGFVNRAVNFVVNAMNHCTALFSDHIVTHTQDYADASPFLKKYRGKISFILPPVQCALATSAERELFRRKYQLQNCYPVIGMAARMAAEKGVEVLVEALPRILSRHPSARVLYAGQYRELYGEEKYVEKLMPMIKPYEEKGVWNFLGLLPDDQLSAFFRSIDVFVVPSLNSTEAYGMVQIEAMMNGVPVVISDLPGVRQPVLMTGRGKIIPVGDSPALAESICALASETGRSDAVHPYAAKLHDPDYIAAQYESMFGLLLNKKRGPA